jgi:anti-sigma factor ChrR (cupin superfamily)
MMRLMAAMMPSCREVTSLLASDDAASASWMKRILIRVHLSMCEHCARLARQLRAISQTLRLAWAPLPANDNEPLKRRILDRLHLS